MLHIKTSLSEEDKKQIIPERYLPVAHDVDAADHSPLGVQFSFATGLGLFCPTNGGGFFAPIKDSEGASVSLWIAAEKEISVGDITVVQDADPVGNFGAIPVYVEYGTFPAEGFGGERKTARLVADFGSMPTGGYRMFALNNTNNIDDSLLIYHSSIASDNPALESNLDGDGNLAFNVVQGQRGYIATREGRAMPFFDEVGSSGQIFVHPSNPILYYESASGGDKDVSTVDLFQSGGVYGGVVFDPYLDEETGEVFHNVAFVSVLTLILQYPSYNILIELPYTADITGLKNLFAKGESAMGQDDAIVAVFDDEENHRINCSRTQTPNMIGKAS